MYAHIYISLHAIICTHTQIYIDPYISILLTFYVTRHKTNKVNPDITLVGMYGHLYQIGVKNFRQ